MFAEVGKLIDKKEAPGNLDKALELLEALEREHPENDIVRGKLAHVYYYKGRFAPAGSKEREAHFERGVQCGEQAITLNPRAVYGNYWYGSNLGMLGSCRGVMASLRSVDPMHNAMQVVLKENEKFFFAGPHRALGRLYHQAPGWPISIGKKAKAAEHLERAVQLAPHYFLNRLFLAELLLDIGKKKQSKEHLQYLIDTPLHPDHAIEDGDYQSQARAMYSKLF